MYYKFFDEKSSDCVTILKKGIIMKRNKKIVKVVGKENFKEVMLWILEEKGYRPYKCNDFTYKQNTTLFYISTGSWYNEYTKEKGMIYDLPHIDPVQNTKYYNLDREFVPDWVFEAKHQEFVNNFNK